MKTVAELEEFLVAEIHIKLGQLKEGGNLRSGKFDTDHLSWGVNQLVRIRQATTGADVMLAIMKGLPEIIKGVREAEGKKGEPGS